MSRPRLPVAAAAVLAASAAAIASTLAGPAETRGRPAPARIDTAEVTLFLLDVEAVDRDGRPLRGLKKGDFRVALDYRDWPIYSVDDFCADAREASPPEDAAKPRASGPSRLILYFDFSQMQLDGRHHARAEAERIVRESMEPGDELMLAAYSSAKGLRRLTPFTSDKGLLLTVLRDAFEDRDYYEMFAFELPSRVEECESFPKRCGALAQMEYWHGLQSMKALRMFMTGLGSDGERKSLILLTQNGVIFPGKLYGNADAPDHYASSQEVAAAANGAQTALYTANAASEPGSDLAKEERVLADNLADFTGGGFNRGAFDLAKLTAEARRGGRCFYRIGLLPPDHPTRDVLTAKVTAGGVVLDRRYRVRFASERDRWLSRATAVLSDPASARDLDVAAAIVPVEAAGSRWSAAVEIAFDTGSLSMIPSAAGRLGSYEVGAFLYRTGRSSGIEMLSVYQVRRGADDAPSGAVVHRRAIERLTPGEYHLAAFVRDRTLNVFGGAEASITLPDPKRGGFAGPLLGAGPRPRTILPLQLFGGASEAAGAASIGPATAPAFSASFRSGEILSGRTWICPGKKSAGPVVVRRDLTREGASDPRTLDAAPAPAGDCLLFTDLIDTALLEPDGYAYHVRWKPELPIPDLGWILRFDVIDPARALP